MISKLYFGRVNKLNNILITGSTGFIGRRLVKAIDSNIRILSRNDQSILETIVCDFEKDSIPDNALKDIDTVFHLAGIAHDTSKGNKVSSLYQKVNVNATIDLAELAIRSGVKSFIFVSSVKAGGSSALGQCLCEKNQGEPEGIYGKTKREAELKLLKLGKESGMNVTVIRSSLVYGPEVKGNLKLLFSGINKGWFPPLPKTNNKKSMIHVDDLVRAILLIAEDSRANGEVFIATDGSPYSSSEIYDLMSLAAGKPIKKWRVPKLFFNMVASLSPGIKYKLDKLMSNDCYSSEKLEKLGFKSKKTLKEMNETIF